MAGYTLQFTGEVGIRLNENDKELVVRPEVIVKGDFRADVKQRCKFRVCCIGVKSDGSEEVALALKKKNGVLEPYHYLAACPNKKMYNLKEFQVMFDSEKTAPKMNYAACKIRLEIVVARNNTELVVATIDSNLFVPVYRDKKVPQQQQQHQDSPPQQVQQVTGIAPLSPMDPLSNAPLTVQLQQRMLRAAALAKEQSDNNAMILLLCQEIQQAPQHQQSLQFLPINNNHNNNHNNNNNNTMELFKLENYFENNDDDAEEPIGAHHAFFPQHDDVHHQTLNNYHDEEQDNAFHEQMFGAGAPTPSSDSATNSDHVDKKRRIEGDF